MSLEQRAAREEELVHSVAALTSQREALGAQLKALRVAVDAEQKLVAEVAALDALRGGCAHACIAVTIPWRLPRQGMVLW